jgi:Cu2+-exporting ATPase
VSEIVTLAASAEQALGHPIAESIVRYAHDHEVALRPCTDWNYCTGLGVEARVDGQLLNVGNRRYMALLGVNLNDLDRLETDPQLEIATRVYVALGGILVGIITCTDPLRANAAAIITQLQSEEIIPLIVSGDSQPVTTTVAATLGVPSEHVYAEMLPDQKYQLVQALQAQGRRVAFVGDGVNDAVAMAHADVAITLGGATDLALETADIVLTNDDPQDLFVARAISMHAMHLIRQNKALVVVPNIGGIAYAALTVMNPVVGVVINNGSAAVAALNSLRPLAGSKKKVEA